MTLTEVSNVENSEQYYTITQLKDRYIVEYSTLRRLVRAGKIGGVVYNHKWFLNRSDVDSCLVNVRIRGLLTLAEAGKRLGVIPITVLRWIHKGKIEGVKRACRYYVSESDVQALIEAEQNKPSDLIVGIQRIADIIEVSYPTVLNYIKTKDLPAWKEEGVWYSRRELLDKWIIQENSRPMRVYTVAKKLHVSRQTIYNWINSGQLDTVVIGKIKFVAAEDVKRLMEEYTTRPEKRGLVNLKDLAKEVGVPVPKIRGYAVRAKVKPIKYMNRLYFSKSIVPRIVELVHKDELKAARKEQMR